MELNLIIIALTIYLIGSIPFAFIITKISGQGDIRNIGSGNVGATNVFRTGKKSLALIVLFLDILKGYAPTFYISNFIFDLNSNELIIYLIGSTAILGHIFPIWMKFKGGKGVATFIGYIFAVNYFLGLIFISSWLCLFFLKKYSSLASIVSLSIIPFAMLFLNYKTTVFLFFFIVSIILITRHYSNIKRLLINSEPKIKL